MQLKNYLYKKNILIVLVCHIFIIFSLYFNMVWLLIPIIFLYLVFVIKKIKYYWWSLISIIFLISFYLLLYDVNNYYLGYVIKNQDGIVVNVNLSYVIVKTRDMFLYIKIPFNEHFYIDEHIKISGKLVDLGENNYYSFNFSKYLNFKNVFFKLDISKIEKLNSNSIRYLFWKWINNLNLSDLFLASISSDYLKNNKIYDDLETLGLTFMLNFSSLYGFVLTWIISKFRNFKIRFTINFTILMILIFYAY